jgi:transcriptional regulator with XRE-family HTH domain
MNKPKYNRLKAVLAEKGVSSKDLAKMIGCAEGTVSTWCRNFKQPSIETLFKIAERLQIEPAELIASRNFK